MTAKFAYGLIARIVRHMLERGYVRPGELVGDPFGGIGTGGIVCAANGLCWMGVELEEKFVALAERNFALNPWCRNGECRIVQGDSRNFAKLIGECAAVCCSPPYSETLALSAGKFQPPHTRADNGRNPNAPSAVANNYGTAPGQLAAMPMGKVDAVISSPPYAATYRGQESGAYGHVGRSQLVTGYGTTEGNLAALPNGTVEEIIALTTNAMPIILGSCKHNDTEVIADKDGDDFDSPFLKGMATNAPTAEQRHRLSCCMSITSTMQQKPVVRGIIGQKTSSRSVSHATAADTIESPNGPLGNINVHSVVNTFWLADTNESCVAEKPVDSPTIDKKQQRDGIESAVTDHAVSAEQRSPVVNGDDGTVPKSVDVSSITDSHANSNRQPENYWSAIKRIYEQCYIVLKPGGVCVIVIADFVRKGKLVPLCDDTLRLLTSIGFTPLERIRAWQVKYDDHPGLFPEQPIIRKTTRRASFFRILAEKKGSPPKLWETVLILRKPVATVKES